MIFRLFVGLKKYLVEYVEKMLQKKYRIQIENVW